MRCCKFLLQGPTPTPTHSCHVNTLVKINVYVFPFIFTHAVSEIFLQNPSQLFCD